MNNAGISVVGPLLYQPLTEFRRQLEVNLISPLLVTQAFAKLLGTDRTLEGRPGRIVDISSAGGKIGAPFLGAYAASKHGLEGMSESLCRELILLIEPGYVNTPILDKAEMEDLQISQGTIDSSTGLFAADARNNLRRCFGLSGWRNCGF